MYADNMIKTFGDLVREKRDDLGLTVRALAKKLGDISPAHVSDIENGRRYPSEELLKRLANVLDVSLEELQSRDVRPPVDELRRMIQRDPAYGIALRKLTESPVAAHELLRFLERRRPKK